MVYVFSQVTSSEKIKSTIISRNLSRENPVKMSTEIGDFLENFRRKILHWEIYVMNTVQWQGFGRGWRFCFDYFPGIYQIQFCGISHNPLQWISRNPFQGISQNPFWEISCNHFQGISMLPILENNQRKCQPKLG